MVIPKRQSHAPDPTTENIWEEDVHRFSEVDFTDGSPEGDAIHLVPSEGQTIYPTDVGVPLDLEHEQLLANLAPTGGDVDSDEYLARVAGEEAVGGTTPTPDQNVVEDLAIAAGIEISDLKTLHTNDLLEQRDAHRWELLVESAEDYRDRQATLEEERDNF
jgi:hypothetical protein